MQPQAFHISPSGVKISPDLHFSVPFIRAALIFLGESGQLQYTALKVNFLNDKAYIIIQRLLKVSALQVAKSINGLIRRSNYRATPNAILIKWTVSPVPPADTLTQLGPLMRCR